MEDKTLLVKVDQRHECVGIGCRSWFCHCCMVGKALALRADLIKAVETFKGVFMLTLTVDPKIFNDPVAEFEYTKKKRSVAKLVAVLREEAKLYSDRFFCIREFHKDGRIHYHVLLDAAFIDIARVRELWGENEPKGYKRPPGDNSPRFGSVVYTRKPFADRVHAARYVTKYLTKTPEEGFPAWVTQYHKRLQRYSVSHGFWSTCNVKRGRNPLPCPGDCDEPENKPAKSSDVKSCDAECFCDKCVGDDALGLVENRGGTIGQRVGKCCSETAVLALEEWMKEDGELVQVRRYLGRVTETPDQVAEGLAIAVGTRRFTVTPDEVENLLGIEVDRPQPDDPDIYDRWLEDMRRGIGVGLPVQSEADRRHAFKRRRSSSNQHTLAPDLGAERRLDIYTPTPPPDAGVQ